ncbi:hypothetical protein [uncultured Microbacterium sp.]|uniref:hypothetical protein n=1 Tax=uncultured Microbacterium sp. TaxID=191216 RepID=UPI0025E8A039|nr:hypothetical protein [uncultured Microbacterium sp.]
MSYLDSMAISPGDAVRAVGKLGTARSGHVLTARMEGIYLELSRALGGETAHVKGLADPPLDEVVTVRGTWTGSEISDGRVFAARVDLRPHESLNPRRFPQVPGVAQQSDILRAKVLEACEPLRGRSLLSFVAVPGPRGWFGLAAATDAEEVRDQLGPLLHPHLLVTESAWTLGQVEEVESVLGADDNVRNIGMFWDVDGRFRANGLLHHVTPELAASLDAFPAEIAHVCAWLMPDDPDVPSRAARRRALLDAAEPGP